MLTVNIRLGGGGGVGGVSMTGMRRSDALATGSPTHHPPPYADHFLPQYRRTCNSWPVSFTVCACEWVYATNLSRLQRETIKQHVGEAHSVLITVILLPKRLSCYWGRIVSLRMLADLRLTTAQQRTTGQNLPSGLYCVIAANMLSK
jgi:hypothetical protein